MSKSKPKSKLSESTIERLLLCMEENGEISQAASKIIRFGPEGTHPDNPTGPTNLEHFCCELGGLAAILSLMEDNQELDLELIDTAQDAKLRTIGRYTKHQGAYREF